MTTTVDPITRTVTFTDQGLTIIADDTQIYAAFFIYGSKTIPCDLDLDSIRSSYHRATQAAIHAAWIQKAQDLLHADDTQTRPRDSRIEKVSA
ncbi:hypothetical protein [Sulfobacillus thermosulfidooxidans]|uniref:hypothetical protein n=1 Tax=Sulfobacillus thermosulfidooxidans TaxID=28034 RepID=UPI0006B41365|nr:hypothetical protein [Sulfobacillus thermosulfidooxidans]